MEGQPSLVFGPFRLDPHDERLWRGHEVIPLSPKAFAVLCRLVTHAGQLVSKAALLEAVWPETAVSEAVLTVAIRRLRRGLGDRARTPQFIETVHSRGYRFIAPVAVAAPSAGRPGGLGAPSLAPATRFGPPPHFVGRDAELAQLAQWWTTARQGTRQVGLIAGEPGIGKTALVEAFVAQVRATEDVLVGHGQCLDRYGAGEAYLPILEALGRLGRGPAGASLVAVLRQYAPSWLVHLPALLAAEERARLEPLASGVTPARMLRELAEALEVLTAARPLVLVLEDLHWSDHATLEWLAYVVRRCDPARLLLLGTYRPVDVMVHAPALRAMVAELRHHPQYAELVLDALSAAATAAYLRQRCGATSLPPGLAQLLHQRTSGNPLFLVAMVDELGRQGLLETAGDAGGSQEPLEVLSGLVPTSLQQYIEQHLEQLSDEDQALLDAASVAGTTFAVAAVAAGVAQAPETLEARLTALARRRRFIRASGTEIWPDGTVTACYQFLHALYYDVVYARVSAGHRVRLHQHIGIRKEAGYGAHARQIAAELAVHFTRGHDAWRAVHYCYLAGENAWWRSAYQEMISHCTTAVELLETLPDTVERAQRETVLQLTLGRVWGMTKGWGASAVGQAYARARELCQQGGEPPQLFEALAGLHDFYSQQGEHRTTHELAAQLLRLAQRLPDPMHLLISHRRMGESLLWLGALSASRTHLEQAIALDDDIQWHAVSVYSGGRRPAGLLARNVVTIVLWLLGYPAQARERSQEALTLAWEWARPYSLANALSWAAWLHQCRREGLLMQERVEASLTLATEHGLAELAALGSIMRGWVWVERGQGEEGSPRCARAWPPTAPPAQRCTSRTSAPCSRTSRPTWATPRTASRRWPRPIR